MWEFMASLTSRFDTAHALSLIFQSKEGFKYVSNDMHGYLLKYDMHCKPIKHLLDTHMHEKGKQYSQLRLAMY